MMTLMRKLLAVLPFLFLATPVFAQLDAVKVTVSAGAQRVDPDTRLESTTTIEARVTATNVRVVLTLPNGGTFTDATVVSSGADCVVSPAEIVCTTSGIAVSRPLRVRAGLVTPDRNTGGRVVVQAEVTADQLPFTITTQGSSLLARRMLVTNTNDEGGGSLRQAILESHTLCEIEPCVIAFRLPHTAVQDGRYVIRPVTPLPELRGNIKVDGLTHRLGGQIELDGSLLTTGHGLVLGTGCEVQVLGLIIRNFPYPAIQANRGMEQPSQNCVRELTDTTTRIALNTLFSSYRGIAVHDSALVTITLNTISNNSHSGIYVERSGYAEIIRNRIEHNGASGIFIDAGMRHSSSGMPDGGDISDNVIAHNAHWGIARTGRGEVTIRNNSIFDNMFLAIDLDLDFETPNSPDDENRPPNKPVLFSATWDPAKEQTIVRGMIESGPGGRFNTYIIDLFVSDSLSRAGQAEAQRLAATREIRAAVFDGGVSAEFEFGIPADLRGKFITATNTREHDVSFLRAPQTQARRSHEFPSDTSELSNVLVAQ